MNIENGLFFTKRVCQEQRITMILTNCISDGISQNILSQIFDVIQSDIASHSQVPYTYDCMGAVMKKKDDKIFIFFPLYPIKSSESQYQKQKKKNGEYFIFQRPLMQRN